MKHSHLLLVALLSVITTWVTVGILRPQNTATTPHETSYERVIRTGTLRCGYEYWDSALMKDDKTGKLYGAWVDILNEIGHATGLKIEWSSQVGWGDVGASLKSGKIDAMCAGMWTSAEKAKEIAFTTPMAYQAVEAFVRADDHRFDTGITSLNDVNVKLAVIENDNSDMIAQQDFSAAKRVALGQLNASDSDLLMHVMTGKADATFTVTGLWHQFDKTNGGKIRRLAPDQKLRIFGLAIAVNNDDLRLLQLINSAEQEVQNSGALDKILDKWNNAYPDMFIKPIKLF